MSEGVAVWRLSKLGSVRGRWHLESSRIYWFSGLQLVTALAVRWIFHRQGYRWTVRHTLLCTVVPLLSFLLWTALWWLKVLPADSLPTTWLGERPTLGERGFICLPPLAVAWLLFFTAQGSFGEHDHAS